MSERIIKTGLGPRYKDMLDAVIGQMSDGYWENTPMMRGYWPFVDAAVQGDEAVLEVSTDLYNREFVHNRFRGMTDDAIRKFFAEKIKFLVKEEGLGDWKRDNENETEYLSYDDPYRVKDCYYAYEVLKGRNARKHPEYGDVEEAKKSSPKREKGGTDDDSIESRLVYVGRVTGEYSDGLAWDLASMTRQIKRIRLRVIELLDKFDEASGAGDDDALVEIADELKAFATSSDESKQPVKIKLVEKAKNASAFGVDGAIWVQRAVDGDPRKYDVETDALADMIRTYAIGNRSRIPAGIEAFREYQLAILQLLHGIGPSAYQHAKKLILNWN